MQVPTNTTPKGALVYAQITYYYYRMGSVAPQPLPPPPCPPAPSLLLLLLSENHEWPKEKSNFQVFNGLFQSHDYLLDYERTACT